MRITIVMGAFLPVPPVMGGAIEKVWFALGQEFARRGHEVVQISRAHPDWPRTETTAEVKHLRVRGYDTPRSLLRLKLLDLLYSIRVRQVLPESDVIVTNTFWLPILLRAPKRGVVYVHVGRYPKGQMRFYSHCGRLQAPSQAVGNAIIAQVPALAPKVVVIPYPRPEASQPLPFASREERIVYVGRVHPEKGVHLLINAFRGAIAAGFERWKLVIIGPWESKFGGGGESYWCQLQSAAQGGDIELRGPIFEPEALAREFQRAQLFVYPSFAETGETFGLAPLEAMTHGCAVLVSDLACFHDFVREDETGFIFDHRAGDPAEGLQRKMTQLLSNPFALERVAAAGKSQAEEYSLPRVADQFLQDFQALVSHGRTADR